MLLGAAAILRAIESRRLISRPSKRRLRSIPFSKCSPSGASNHDSMPRKIPCAATP